MRAAQTAVTLLPGVPMRDTVQRGEFDYYVFAVDVDTAVTFVLTPVSGDPDMYIGWSNDSSYRPNATNAVWRSQLVSLDVVTVSPQDPRACHSSGQCNYYIGVTAFGTTATFSLIAYQQDADPIALIDGQPQDGQVALGVTQQYVFLASSGFVSLQVTLTPVLGDADLYIAINSSTGATSANAVYRSTSVNGAETVTLLSSDSRLAACVGVAVCTINIGVYGYSNSTYTVQVVSGQSLTTLQDGVPLFDVVDATGYNYYVFRNENPAANLSFSITPYSGDPDLYVTTNSSMRPSPNFYQWRSSSLGRDVVVVWTTDVHYCEAPCNYYVAVDGYNSNASYAILAESLVNSTIRLTDGRPELSSVDQASVQQYELLIAAGTPTVEVRSAPSCRVLCFALSWALCLLCVAVGMGWVVSPFASCSTLCHLL